MNTTTHDPETLREEVRRRYGSIAKDGVGLAESATPQSGGCRAAAPLPDAKPDRTSGACCGNDAQARALGYSADDLAAVPDGANLGLGCGNPVALAALKRGQTLLDLGAGAGFDAFLAACAVGTEGRVIGVDMTPEMVAKARASAKKGGRANVEFHLGEIEALPVANSTLAALRRGVRKARADDRRAVQFR